MGRLDNKVAIITGAASGIGLATARLFAKEGASLVLTDRNESALKKAVTEIQSNKGKAEEFAHDVSSETDWIRVVEKTLFSYEKIDILVNNAGVAMATGDLEEISPEDWRKVLDINLTGTFLGMKAVLPSMRSRKSGSIVNVSSIAGITGMAGGGGYTASKGGIRLSTKGAAYQYGKDNIRVNSVHPGYIETPMTEGIFQDKNAVKAINATIPLGRVGKPEEIANLILFLASEEASYITGAEMIADGGYTAV